MLPARRQAISEALVAVTALRERDTEVRIRVGLANGSVADGFLLSATPLGVSLRMPHARAEHFPTEQIRSLHVATPRHGREWALAGVGIVGATAALVGLVSLPVLGPYLRAHPQRAFVVVFYAGVGALVVLLAKTGLRDWLTRWETLADVRD